MFGFENTDYRSTIIVVRPVEIEHDSGDDNQIIAYIVSKINSDRSYCNDQCCLACGFCSCFCFEHAVVQPPAVFSWVLYSIVEQQFKHAYDRKSSLGGFANELIDYTQ